MWEEGKIQGEREIKINLTNSNQEIKVIPAFKPSFSFAKS